MVLALEKAMKLNVPYYSQKDLEPLASYGSKACGLTSLRMVLDFYGIKPNFEQLKQIVDKTGAYSEKLGWIHSGLVDIAREYGLKGYRIHFGFLSDEDLPKADQKLAAEGASLEEIGKFQESFKLAKEKGNLTALDRLIKGGIPVLVSMSPDYASTSASHLVVIIGEEKGKYIINDPWNFGPEYQINKEKFVTQWTNRAIVILPK